MYLLYNLHFCPFIPWLDMHMGDISLIDSSEDPLCCRAERPWEKETKWAKSKPWARQVWACLASLAFWIKPRTSVASLRASDAPTRSTQQCRSPSHENNRMSASLVKREQRLETGASSRSNQKWGGPTRLYTPPRRRMMGAGRHWAGVTRAHEGMVTKGVHGCLAARAAEIRREHLHTKAIAQKSPEVAHA